MDMKVFTVANTRGLEVQVVELGGGITSLFAPDRQGRLADVVLGTEPPHGGVIVGRCANRIRNSRFTLDGTTYQLTPNVGPHHLHGGPKGFHTARWKGTPFKGTETSGVVLEYTSPDGEEGYPGTLRTRVTYTVTEKNELIVDYHATTDKPTVVNLTQHSYFNLRGRGGGDVNGHLLHVNADRYTPLDQDLIVTGEIASVVGTIFDFRGATAIGARAPETGYDINYVLNKRGGDVTHAARVHEPESGRKLDVHTTEPGMQLYTGNRSAFCLETQHFPDAPNHPEWPTTILHPGETYRSRTMFTFGVQ